MSDEAPNEKKPWRNRIVEHIQLPASELLPHENNPRIHGSFQKEALIALGREVGFARSLLGYRDALGRVRLIDGHLRREVLGNGEVCVEILDVTDDEARKLLLSIDPLAALAETERGPLEILRNLVATDEDALATLWASIETLPEEVDLEKENKAEKAKNLPEKWLVLIECENEAMQVLLLAEMQTRGIPVKALVS
ncbi:MAG: hypothetical protein NT142_11595 [Planctomycetota bacterium]|nr:hypothetical protein [Planctomycetota bacterium]